MKRSLLNNFICHVRIVIISTINGSRIESKENRNIYIVQNCSRFSNTLEFIKETVQNQAEIIIQKVSARDR